MLAALVEPSKKTKTIINKQTNKKVKSEDVF